MIAKKILTSRQQDIPVTPENTLCINVKNGSTLKYLNINATFHSFLLQIKT